MFVVFVPVATCGVLWASRRIRDTSTGKLVGTQVPNSSNSESKGCDPHSLSQQPTSSTVSTQLESQKSHPTLSAGLPHSAVQPATSTCTSISTGLDTSVQRSNFDSAADVGTTPLPPVQSNSTAAAIKFLHAHAAPSAHPEIVREGGVQMVAVGGSAALPGASGATVKGVRPFSASGVPVTALDGHSSNHMINSVLAQHIMLTDLPEVSSCCVLTLLCPHPHRIVSSYHALPPAFAVAVPSQNISLCSVPGAAATEQLVHIGCAVAAMWMLLGTCLPPVQCSCTRECSQGRFQCQIDVCHIMQDPSTSARSQGGRDDLRQIAIAISEPLPCTARSRAMSPPSQRPTFEMAGIAQQHLRSSCTAPAVPASSNVLSQNAGAYLGSSVNAAARARFSLLSGASGGPGVHTGFHNHSPSAPTGLQIAGARNVHDGGGVAYEAQERARAPGADLGVQNLQRMLLSSRANVSSSLSAIYPPSLTAGGSGSPWQRTNVSEGDSLEQQYLQQQQQLAAGESLGRGVHATRRAGMSEDPGMHVATMHSPHTVQRQAHVQEQSVGGAEWARAAGTCFLSTLISCLFSV
jgi:hypothetical protein